MAIHVEYRGPLLASNDQNKRIKEKQRIRRALHPQLMYYLKRPPMEHFEIQGASYRMGEFSIKPVVGIYPELSCELELRIFTRDPFGSVLPAGDLDNRLKTLFDALRGPRSMRELPKDDEPKGNEKPWFYVLLQDDSQITDLIIRTEKWNTPPTGEEKETEIKLEIALRLKYGDTV